MSDFFRCVKVGEMNPVLGNLTIWVPLQSHMIKVVFHLHGQSTKWPVHK